MPDSTTNRLRDPQAPAPVSDKRRVRLGRGGESLAATWLEARGYRVVARNWRCQWGELDLVAESGDVLVFVEVKTRRGTAYGAPEEAITASKREHLIATAEAYMQAHSHPGADPHSNWRIDVVAVQLDPRGVLLAVRHYPGAVTLDL